MAPNPSPDQAYQMALIVSAGAPTMDAFRYFVPSDANLTTMQMTAIHDRWVRSKEYAEATRKIQGAAWQEMGADERIKFAIDKHYTEMAYFLYAHNYADLTGQDKAKADTCRTALEAKLAGTAGKLSELEQFWGEMRAKAAAKSAAAPVSTLPA